MSLFNKISWLALKKYRQWADCLDGTALNLRNQVFQCRQLYRHIDFPPIGDKPPAFSRSASANLLMIFSPEF
jgi:hypothetical protein